MTTIADAVSQYGHPTLPPFPDLSAEETQAVELRDKVDTVWSAAAASRVAALPSSEDYTCPSRRCEAKRERQNKAGCQYLFTAGWRQMAIRGLIVWVVDITVRCPQCTLKQTRTLIPPALEPAQPR